jgi:arabinonate dehydratase
MTAVRHGRGLPARTLQLHTRDNVAIALVDIAAGEASASENIPAGHKFAVAPIAAGETIIKYGQPIGTATAAIAAGAHVHVHNVSAELVVAARPAGNAAARQDAAPDEQAFQGYVRRDGAVGTRNYVGIISTVNCSATVIRQIAAQIGPGELQGFANVDGLCPITHATGCGMSSKGEGFRMLQRTLGGYIRHPNMGGVLIVGLGCEVNDIDGLLRHLQIEAGDTIRTMAIQDVGGTRAAIEQGAATVRELLMIADTARREPVPVSAIKLGLQCGGSDAFSGITANPALGLAADKLVAAGGTVILGETPEIVGAEHLLLARAETPAVAAALNARLQWWRAYVAMHGAALDNNPSPGNIAGGITTILEKSLGAVMKSGSSPLRAVCEFAEPVAQHGFVFMDSPGYDPCSVTGEIATGANVICFTTGRGSVFGAKPVPSIKLASNSKMAERMHDDIDVDCGGILTGGKSLQQAAEEIYSAIVATAGGERSASERNGLGDFEFVPWQLGAVL